MTDDIVVRLRSPINVFYEYAADDGTLLRQAAAEIERLREENDKLRAFYEAATRPNPERVKTLPPEKYNK